MHLKEIQRATAAFLTLPTILFSAILSPIFKSGVVCALPEDSEANLDSLRPRAFDYLNIDDVPDGRSENENLAERYVPDFIGVSRGIIGRAGDEMLALDNNQPGKPQNGLQSGQTIYYTFPKEKLFGPKSPATPGLPSTLARRNENASERLSSNELRKRQSQAELYITLTTCSQPLPNDANTNGAAGQLQLFISTSSSNHKPDQNKNDFAVSMDGGFAMTNVTASDDVFFSVSAPNNNGFTGNYDYELTASIDDFYAMYYDQTYNRIVDTDTSSVLIFTNDTTSENSSTTVFQQWMNTSAFSAYVYHQNNPAIIGIQRSWCALDTHKQVYANSKSSNTSMTTTVDGQPKQQFYIQGLNGSSAYYAIVAIEGNSTDSGDGVVNGGGTVWLNTDFKTKSDNNCKILFNLAFCSDVGYAVPWNSTTNYTALAQIYDNHTSNAYSVFNKSLQQVACNTTSSAQYSLERNCNDCANAYKQWLCAVSIPRCEDFSNNAYYLQPRAISQNFTSEALSRKFTNDDTFSPENKMRTYMNTSRNPLIDSTVVPGPYKEVLPCQNLCYHLVQSCPAVLQFACPLPGFGLNYSYGTWNASLPSGEYSCNPMALAISHATSLGRNSRLWMAVASATILAFVFL